jgi:hypothetical protein
MAEVATVNDRGSYDERRLTARWTADKPVEVAPVAQPAIEIKGRVLARVDDYNEMCGAFRARSDELQITRLELDYLSKLQDGYSSKILGPSQIKSLGKKSLGGILRGTGTYLVLVEDAAATASILARAKPRKVKRSS